MLLLLLLLLWLLDAFGKSSMLNAAIASLFAERVLRVVATLLALLAGTMPHHNTTMDVDIWMMYVWMMCVWMRVDG